MRFDKNPFTGQCKKKTERLKGFKFRTFMGRFQMTSWQRRGQRAHISPLRASSEKRNRSARARGGMEGGCGRGKGGVAVRR